MKCPNCNSEIREGSIICPICNTQFAFTANDNFINLPDDEFVIKSNGVEEYVNPHEHEENFTAPTKGVINLKTNTPPKKVIKKVVKVQTVTKPVEEESVVISPSVNVDMNDEVINEKPVDMETTVVNVGGFTNTIIDTTSALNNNEVNNQQTTYNQAPPVTTSDPGVFAPTTNNAVGLQTISSVDAQTNTIGQVSVVEEPKEKKPRKKMSETMLLAMVMGLIVILLSFIVYILVQNNKEKESRPITTTQMTTVDCSVVDCNTTTTTITTTVETTTTTKLYNQGLKSTKNQPLAVGQLSICSIYDPSNSKDYKVDVRLDKIFTPEEAQAYMKNYNNTTYQDGLSVGVLQYTLTGNELDDGVELNPVTSIEFYPSSVDNNFAFNGKVFKVGFTGTSDEKLTNKKSVTVTGYYNYPSDQPVGYVCIGDYDGQKGCFKLN